MSLNIKERAAAMIVDSSALVAIIGVESDARRYIEALFSSPSSVMSAFTYLESSIVVDRSHDPAASRQFDTLLRETGIDVVAVTPEQARIAREASRDFGKSSGHPAGPNFGDRLAYALAKDHNEAMLYEGDDFAHTDIRRAMET